MATDWIAVDLRAGVAQAWAMDGSDLRATATAALDPAPGAAPEAAPAAIAGLVEDWLGETPVATVVSGLAGAVAPPPCPVPVKVLDIAPVPVSPPGAARLRMFAVPGLKQAAPPGLMQGAETRIAGFLSLNPNWDGVICLPGPVTHWAQVSAEEIVSFQSFLSLDLAAALTRGSLLRPALSGNGWDEAAFCDALDDSLSRPERLAARLAELRARDLLQTRPPGEARARLSGILIGAELAAARPYWLGQQLAIIGPDEDAALYTAALARHGVPATVVDGERMALAGLIRARGRLMDRA